MNPLKYLKGKYLQGRNDRACQKLISQPLIHSIDPENLSDSLQDPSAYYLRSFQDFHNSVPNEIKDHRKYFCQNQRGFGEDAFHVMWWRLVRQFKPASFLEIGVYRGQVVSLISLLGRMEGIQIETTGISPFSSAGDSVSNYRDDLDYLQDTQANIRHFGLPEATFVNAYSTDPDALAVIASRKWDMIYIDGNHDYDVVLQDWNACSEAVDPGGIIVLDDSGLTTSYRPPPFATGGHPGPSQLAKEIDPKRFKEILQMGHNRVFQKIA